ncbi:MAG: ABC transporter ATP-binding protein, partial [Acidobacteria bacterium]|nr:ABC transporter ATP-binding protein [Acidobacteriota bacterium]
DLSFSYPRAERRAVDGLSFAVERGEIFGFLGPNGAGKSTTQRILIGLLRDFEGQVSMLGKPVGDWGSDYYEHVGVVFEFPNHYLKLTGLENLSYFRALYDEGTRSPSELLDRVGLGGDGNMMVGQYSKGMKSRLSMARALLNEPELLFLDEPTAGLDPASGRNIKELIREQKEQGKTVFLTTHDMAVADQLCDRVAFIVDGRIDLIDSPRELKLRHGEHRLRVDYLEDGRLESREFLLAGLGDNEGFFRLLRGADVQTMHTLEATLEDVFIQVTGQSLR